MFSRLTSAGEYIKPEVTQQTTLIDQILAALGGASPEPVVLNALLDSGSVYLTVEEE